MILFAVYATFALKSPESTGCDRTNSLQSAFKVKFDSSKQF
ncbi:hypothetical protein [Scytonema sp. HK-05]